MDRHADLQISGQPPSRQTQSCEVQSREFWPLWHRSFALAAGLTALASTAWAQGGNLQPVQSTLQQLIQVLTGPIATSLAILAVIALGMMAWVGRLTWYFAGSIIFGIVLVFGSSQIVQFFQSAVGR